MYLIVLNCENYTKIKKKEQYLQDDTKVDTPFQKGIT